MATSTSSNAMLNQVAMVLNFPVSVCLRLAFMEPAVMISMATIIMVLCSIPKNGSPVDERHF